MSASLEINRQQYRQIERELGNLRKRAPQAAAAGINRTLNWVRTQVDRRTRQETTLTRKSVFRRVQLEQAQKGKLFGKVVIRDPRGQPPSLMSFRPTPRQTRQGVVATLRPGRRERFPRGFIATPRRGGVPAVYRRRGKNRYPLERLVGPSPVGIIRDTRVGEQIQGQAGDRLQSELLGAARGIVARDAARRSSRG